MAILIYGQIFVIYVVEVPAEVKTLIICKNNISFDVIYIGILETFEIVG